VRRAFVRGDVGTPKSRRSTRSVPLAAGVATELELPFPDSRLQGDDDLVFAHPATDKPIDRSRLLKRYKAAVRRAGVGPVRFHDLRHTFGTRMAAEGVPMRTLQEWMGHRDVATTLIYADFAPSEQQETAWVEKAIAPVEADTFCRAENRANDALRGETYVYEQAVRSTESPANRWVFC
jgi:integrase